MTPAERSAVRRWLVTDRAPITPELEPLIREILVRHDDATWKVRDWARRNGYTVADVGPITDQLRRDYAWEES